MKKLKLKIGNCCASIIRFLSRKAKIDLISLGYIESGLTQSQSLDSSGETHFVSSILTKKIQNSTPIFFDVGANKGEYTALLRQYHPTATIHSFEPNPTTFEYLKKNCSTENHLNNLGLGKETGALNLFFDSQNETSVQATSDREILEVIAKTEQISSITIDVTTLSNYCTENNIEFIDLLKIDTEGFELEVLQGAESMLQKGQIGMIQFEFNEINVVKRRFIKDFYDCLSDFDFYRLAQNKIIPLGEWSAKHEIFLFQNILAIKKDLSSK